MRMTEKKKALIQAIALLIVGGLLFWHALHWHTTGMYRQMLGWLATSKVYLTVLYNLGLMLAAGTVLGLLMDRITVLVSREKREEK